MMADNDQNNDEYKFAELDSLDNESMENDAGLHHSTASGQGPYVERTNVKRNALIVIAIIILAMVIYKLSGVLFPGKSNVDSTQSSVAPVTPLTPITPQPVKSEITPTPTPVRVEPQPQTVVSTSDNDLKQKVSSLEQSQQNVRAEVNTVGQQVGTVNNNVNNLNNQIAKLNQVIENLSNQVAKQSEEISILMARSQPKPPKTVKYRIKTQPLVYYIQAVIPGRAWLIGTNGSTLTVREGTRIAGYGTVKLIDSLQGRVLTSSGHIIRFSQADS